MTDPLDLDALAELERKATEGPWWPSTPNDEYHDPSEVRCRMGLSLKDRVLLSANPHFPFDDDLALVCALRNHARTLIAEARRAREYRDALTKQRMYAVATGKLTTPSAMHAMMQRMVDDIDDALLRREDERG